MSIIEALDTGEYTLPPWEIGIGSKPEGDYGDTAVIQVEFFNRNRGLQSARNIDWRYIRSYRVIAKTRAELTEVARFINAFKSTGYLSDLAKFANVIRRGNTKEEMIPVLASMLKLAFEAGRSSKNAENWTDEEAFLLFCLCSIDETTRR